VVRFFSSIARRITRLNEGKALLSQTLKDFIAARERHLRSFSQFIASKWLLTEKSIVSLGLILIESNLL
jgi:hypothetical protein